MTTHFVRRARRASSVGCSLVLLAASARASEPHSTSKDVRARPAAATPASPGPKAVRSSRPTFGGARRADAAAPASADFPASSEDPDLRALRDAEHELFPGAPAPASAWPSELSPAAEAEPGVLATGLPPVPPPLAEPAEREPAGWLAHLRMPDLPVRWDDRVLRYLRFFRSDPRGHAAFANLYRRSGRWREMMRRVLRRKSLPEDLVWVSMIESGFDPAVRSRAGAAGLWQFMPDTAKLYGLVLDRWLDQRLDVRLATEAAADCLGDLHRRFGSWELALAAFNMGSVGVSSVVRRYNTNDFWSLAQIEGTFPWETTLYVPKVLAAAVVARNLAAFGLGDVAIDPPEESDEIVVSPGTPLSIVAQAAGAPVRDLEALNPALRAGRAPPPGEAEAAYTVRVPQGRGSAALRGLARLRRDQPPLDKYVVRFGETLESVAQAHGTTAPRLVELNAISPAEAVRGGTVLLVPHVDDRASAHSPEASRVAPARALDPRPSVVVPSGAFVYPDRRRVFYRVVAGDTLEQIAGALRVSRADLCRWNDLDASARLELGMTLQVFIAPKADLSRVRVASENDVRVLPVGSDEFFATIEHERGLRRLVVAARAGETIESIGKRFRVSARKMERINRRSRREALRDGERVVVYLPASSGRDAKLGASGAGAEAAVTEPVPNGPLPPPPAPERLP